MLFLKKYLKKVSILTLHKLVHTLMGWLDREKNVTFSIFAFASLIRYLILHTRYYINLFVFSIILLYNISRFYPVTIIE